MLNIKDSKIASMQSLKSTQNFNSPTAHGTGRLLASSTMSSEIKEFLDYQRENASLFSPNNMMNTP